MQNGAVINRYVWDDIAKGTLQYPLKCVNEVDEEKPPVVEVRRFLTKFHPDQLC